MCGNIARAYPPFAFAFFVVARQCSRRNIIFCVGYVDISCFGMDTYSVGHFYLFFRTVCDEILAHYFFSLDVYNTVRQSALLCYIVVVVAVQIKRVSVYSHIGARHVNSIRYNHLVVADSFVENEEIGRYTPVW